VRLSSRFALAAALALSLSTPLGSRGSHRLSIGRDDGPSNPIKIIRRIIVSILDELEIPKP
jgi:hypothetical protein